MRSTVEPTEAVAWIVDGFGVAHSLADRSMVGRAHEGQLVVLAASVSREHAELRRTETGWQVRDLGSRNGTFVDGVRAQGRHALDGRKLVKFGDVPMWFLSEVAHEPLPPASISTATAAGGLVRFALATDTMELCLVGTTDPTAGGSLLTRASAASAWTERGLAPLEFQLLRTLCAQAIEEASSPSTVRGCVQTKQLARDLPFQSRYANEENVRQVVRRLRAVLSEGHAESILSVSPGRGYYLSCRVSHAATDPAARA